MRVNHVGVERRHLAVFMADFDGWRAVQSGNYTAARFWVAGNYGGPAREAVLLFGSKAQAESHCSHCRVCKAPAPKYTAVTVRREQVEKAVTSSLVTDATVQVEPTEFTEQVEQLLRERYAEEQEATLIHTQSDPEMS